MTTSTSLLSRVAIIQRIVPHYRVPFFRALRARLQLTGIELIVIYGQERTGTVPRTVQMEEPWAIRIENVYASLLGRELVWQPCWDLVSGADLVIVEQSNRLLVNFLLMLFKGRRMMAYWGHGRNMQAAYSRSLSERFKRRISGKVNWWFAYTRLSAEYVSGTGFPVEKITNVQNAIDTSALRQSLNECSDEVVAELKSTLGIHSGSIGLYCGGMYDFKRLPFLIEACERIRESMPDFSMIFVGNGPEQNVVERAAAKHDWLHFVGPKFGEQLAPYYRMANVLLMPGLVGLAVVDSFVAGLPLFTTDLPLHSPEIAYLQNGVNGVVTLCDIVIYAQAVIDFLCDAQRRACMRQACLDSAQVYSLENMVENFATGIERCLQQGTPATMTSAGI